MASLCESEGVLLCRGDELAVADGEREIDPLAEADGVAAAESDKLGLPETEPLNDTDDE